MGKRALRIEQRCHTKSEEEGGRRRDGYRPTISSIVPLLASSVAKRKLSLCCSSPVCLALLEQQNWAPACERLGRNGAAVCLILTDRATQRPENQVTKPAGYFRAMVNRAKTGELKLHKSIFGIVERCQEQESH